MALAANGEDLRARSIVRYGRGGGRKEKLSEDEGVVW